MKLTQNQLENLQDLVQRGELTAAQANVEKVKAARVELVLGRLPASVRNALNNAVKNGELCHIKKDGRKPEVYYYPPFEYLAKDARNKHEKSILQALCQTIARPEF